MGRKILGWIVLIVLFAGTICGIVFGVKYSQADKNSSSDNISYIETLEAEISNLEQTRIDLLEEITFIEAKNELFEEEISELETEIESLKSQLAELQKELEYKTALLQAYEDSEKYAVAFYVEDELQKLILVEPNSYVDIDLITAPIKENHAFLGWAVEGTTDIIDLTTYTITSKTNFEAVFKQTTEILFSGEQEISFGSPTSLYNNDYVLSLPHQFGFDTLLYTGYTVTFEVALYCHEESGLATGGTYTFVEDDTENIAHWQSPNDNWATATLLSVARIYLKFTDIYSGYYGVITIHEIIGNVK